MSVGLKTQFPSVRRPAWFWIGAGALSFGMAALVFTYSILTVQADTPLIRLSSTPAPGVPESTLTPAVIKPAKPLIPPQALKGVATWYGDVLEGHRTASGEPFEMLALTAAHKTLPFGTKVRVIDLNSRRSIVVRINDRGVLPGSHVIDLSYAAAKELHILRAGVVPVKLEVISMGPAQH